MLGPDSLLNERYRLTYAIDERADSMLYRAADQREGRQVLIAALPQADAATMEHTRAVARHVATIQAPGLLPLRDHFADGMTFYMVIDDPGGQDLERVLRERGGALPDAVALQQIDRLLEALDLCHSKKPELLLGELRSTDIWVSADGECNLAPFAFVRPIGAEPSPYRAPELNDTSTEPTTSSDLYALGAVGYHLLTGWAPPLAALRETGTPLNAPRTLNPRISALLEQMLLRVLELKPGNRYQVAREMRRALDMVRLMGDRPLGAVEPSLQTGPQPPPAAQSVPPAYYPPVSPAPAPVAGAEAGSAQGGYAPTPLPPPTLPPAPPTTYPPPGAPPYGVYQAPGQQATMPQRQNNTCLIVVVSVLAVLALVICVVGIYLGLLVMRGGALTLPFGTMASTLPTSPPAVSSATAPPAATPAPAATAAQAQTLDPATLTIANVRTITETREISESLLGPVAYAPDGQQVAVGVGKSIQLRNAGSLELAGTLEGHSGNVYTIAFAPGDAGSSRLLASGATDENNIRIWDLQTKQQVRALQGHSGWIRSLAFAPDGKLLASGGTDDTVRLWDVQNGTLLHTLEGHSNWLGGIAFSPDGTRLASTSRDGTTKLWDVATGTLKQDFTFETPLDPTTAMPYWATGLSFSPDGKLIAVGATDAKVYLLNAETGAVVRTLEGHGGWIVIRGVAFSPDGKTLASSSLDGTVRLWNPDTGAERGMLERQGVQMLSIAWNNDGTRFLTSSDDAGEVLVWDMSNRSVAQSVRIGQGLIASLSYSPDNQVLGTGGVNGIVRIHLFAENRQLSLTGGAPTFQYLAFLSNAKLAAISDDGSIITIDLTRQQQAEPLTGMDGPAFSLAVSPDRRLLAAGGQNGKLVLWDAQNGQRLRTLEGLNGLIYTIAFSANGQLLVAATSGNAGQVGIWDTQSGTLQTSFTPHDQAITSVAVQENGPLLVTTGRDGRMHFWALKDGSAVRTIEAEQEQGWYSSAAFSPDGTLLVTGSLDGRVEFWDPGTGERVHALDLRSGNVIALAFSPDGKQIAASTREGGIRLLGVQR